MIHEALRWYSHAVSAVAVTTAVGWTVWELYDWYQCTEWCLLGPELLLEIWFIVALAVAAIAAVLYITDAALRSHYAGETDD